jgi:hypothetical protein
VTSLDHRHLGVVGHQQLRHAAEEGEGPVVRLDPVRELLGPRRQCKRQARAAHHRHEDVGTANFPSPAIDHDRNRVAGIVDEQLLAAAVALPHHQRQPPFPSAEQVAETAVTIAVRVLGDVLVPEHLERHVLALELARHHRPVRLGQLAPSRLYPTDPIQAQLQIRVADLGRGRPRKPGTLKPHDHVAHRRSSQTGQPGNLAHRDTSLPMHSHHFAHMAHLRPPRRHSILRLLRRQDGSNDQASHSLPGGRELIGMVAGFSSESRPGSNRNGGRDDPGIRTSSSTP